MSTINANHLGYQYTNEAGVVVKVSAAEREAEQKKVVQVCGANWSEVKSIPAQQRVVVVGEMWQALQEEEAAGDATQYIYARVSTKEQNVEQQVKKLQEEYPSAVVFSEKESGKNVIGREEFQKLRGIVKRGDLIAVLSISRLGRNTGDVISFVDEMKSKGVKVYVKDIGMDVTSTMGKVIMTTIAAIAEMQREDMLDKQRIGIDRAKEEGKYKGKQQSNKTRKKLEEAMEYVAKGISKEKAAKAAGVGVATLYRHIKEMQQ